MTLKIQNAKLRWEKFMGDSVTQNKISKYSHKAKSWLLSIFKMLILIGISFIILGPVINMISESFFSPADAYNPSVFLFPYEPTADNYELAAARLNYWKTLGSTGLYIVTLSIVQILITSMAGYGFARFDFPFKKLLFACVIITIVLPTHTIMLPLYQNFRNWDVFGLIKLFTGEHLNLLQTTTPVYILTLFGTGLRSGLYIYIFRQFFRGLPKEIEEAAFIDGASTWYTFTRIMLVNAMPSVLTVFVFSMVWQYNDMFYVRLFSIPSSQNMSLSLQSLPSNVQFLDQIRDPIIAQIYTYAGVILTIVPILVFYLIVQRYFMESLERSGIVG